MTTYNPKEAAREPHYSYEEKCEELARYFLSDTPDAEDCVKPLSQHIQNAIEAWMEQI